MGKKKVVQEDTRPYAVIKMDADDNIVDERRCWYEETADKLAKQLGQGYDVYVYEEYL